jgi:TonB family protein
MPEASTPVAASDALSEESVSSKSILTQEFEEAPEVVKQPEQPDPEVERERLRLLEEQRIRNQKIEADRIKKAEEDAEKKRVQEEKERIAREAAEQEARRLEIVNRTRNALNSANATGSASNANQGITGGTGNQGSVTGSTDSNIYGEGTGTGTRGISYNLAGRQPTKIPPPNYDTQSEGIVVVEVTVDRNGNVTQATPGVKGSTTLEEYFLRVAKEAAEAAKFDAKPDAPLFQKGTITYHFILR